MVGVKLVKRSSNFLQPVNADTEVYLLLSFLYFVFIINSKTIYVCLVYELITLGSLVYYSNLLFVLFIHRFIEFHELVVGKFAVIVFVTGLHEAASLIRREVELFFKHTLGF